MIRSITGSAALSWLAATLLVTTLASAAGKKGEEPAPAPAARSHFLVRLVPSDPQAQATEEQRARIVMHFEYLKAQQSTGKVILAGMNTDDFEGLILVNAASRAEAEEIVQNDPAVSGGVYRAELHPFQLVLSAASR